MRRKNNRYRRKKRSGFKVLFITLLSVVSVACVVVFLFTFNGNKKEKEPSKAVDPEFYTEIEKSIYPFEYNEYVSKYSSEFGVPESIIFAIIKTESNFRPNAVSRANACGLMQLTEATYKDCQRWLGETKDDDQIFDVETNIKYGTYYLSRLYNNAYGDWDLVYAAYNAGPGNVSQWLKDPEISVDGKLVNIPFEETDNYVRKVNKAREKYIELYDLGE